MTRHGSTSLQAALGADYARQHSTTSFMPCGSGPPVANYPGTRQHQLGTLREGGLALDPSALALIFMKPTLMSLAQNGTSPRRITSKLRSPALVS